MIELWQIVTALKMSHKSVGGKKGITSSVNSDYNHKSLEVVCDNAQYSSFVLDLATSAFFLELYEIGLGP